MACYLLLRVQFAKKKRERKSKKASVLGSADIWLFCSYNPSKICYKDIHTAVFFHKCRGVIRVACRHFEAFIWT